jgi:hypothetical protein
LSDKISLERMINSKAFEFIMDIYDKKDEYSAQTGARSFVTEYV